MSEISVELMSDVDTYRTFLASNQRCFKLLNERFHQRCIDGSEMLARANS